MPPSTNDLEQHRAALTGHCYRMLGSAVDADDAVQETLVRAWRALDKFDGRSALKTWLYRIATNVCLDQLGDRARRERPIEGPVGTIDDPLVAGENWIEPIGDARAIPADADPAERAILRQSIRLAFVAALQHLSPKERAALLLAEVLGWSAAEVAETLETSVAAVNSALQRARATLPKREVEESPVQRELVDRYVEAFERYDMEALTALLHEDAAMSMPPFSLWLRGPTATAAWMLGRGADCRDSKLVPVDAAGSPAFAQYKQDGSAWSLLVLELDENRIVGQNFFLDTAALFPRLGLPLQIPR